MKLAAVIFDWAGTLVDHGSRAPVATLLAVFEAAGVPILIAEARASMGVAKRSHIRAILELPRVREAWEQKHRALPADSDVEALYQAFIPMQLEGLKRHHTLIPGIPEAVARMRARGLRIGSTTGYTRPMLNYLLVKAREQGFQPDAAICPDDVPAGRPAPWMCYRNAVEIGTYPLSAMIKIGDTPVDMAEGISAGMWNIGVTRSGNEVGLTEEEWQHVADADRRSLLASAEHRLTSAGAHYVAESAAECDAILDQIEVRLARGEKP